MDTRWIKHANLRQWLIDSRDHSVEATVTSVVKAEPTLSTIPVKAEPRDAVSLTDTNGSQDIIEILDSDEEEALQHRLVAKERRRGKKEKQRRRDSEYVTFPLYHLSS